MAVSNPHQQLADGAVDARPLGDEAIAVGWMESHAEADTPRRLVERRNGAPLQTGAAVGGDELVQGAPYLR